MFHPQQIARKKDPPESEPELCTPTMNLDNDGKDIVQMTSVKQSQQRSLVQRLKQKDRKEKKDADYVYLRQRVKTRAQKAKIVNVEELQEKNLCDPKYTCLRIAFK